MNNTESAKYVKKNVNIPLPTTFSRKRRSDKEPINFIPVSVSNKDFKISLINNNCAYLYSHNNIIYFPDKYINTTIKLLLNNSYYRRRGALLIQGLEQCLMKEKTFLDSITLFDVLHSVDNCFNSIDFYDRHLIKLVTIPITIKNSNEKLLILPHLYKDIYLILLCPICGKLLECKVNKNLVHKKRKVVLLEDIEHKCKNRKGIMPKYVILPVKGFYIKNLFVTSSEQTHKTADIFRHQLMYPRSIQNRTDTSQEKIDNTDYLLPIRGSLVKYKTNDMNNHYLVMESEEFGDLRLVINDYLYQEIMSNIVRQTKKNK